MNTTVARIVEIMFQDTVMSDEVQAIKDEVMNNCQERYRDMLARGMNEDEAISAVIDSLKGMEEVINQYPKIHAVDEEDEEDPDKDLVFDPQQVKLVKVLLTSDDIRFESSDDELIHVCYDADDMPNLMVNVQGNTLRIERDNKFEVKHEAPEMDQEWNSFSDFMKGIKKMLSGVQLNMQYGGGGEVTIALPQEHAMELDVHATSGDVEVDCVNVSEVMVESTSGDVSIGLDEDVEVRNIRVKGSSGDVEIEANTAALNVQTVSGDVSCTCKCPNVAVNTVSGDVELSGDMQDVCLRTVSGDAEMDVQTNKLRYVSCTTTSGDLTIRLPESLRGQAYVQMETISGDKHNRYGDWSGPSVAKVNVNMKSVSGDLTLR